VSAEPPLCNLCRQGILHYNDVWKGTFCSNPDCDYALSHLDLFAGSNRTELADIHDRTLRSMRRDRLLPP